MQMNIAHFLKFPMIDPLVVVPVFFQMLLRFCCTASSSRHCSRVRPCRWNARLPAIRHRKLPGRWTAFRCQRMAGTFRRPKKTQTMMGTRLSFDGFYGFFFVCLLSRSFIRIFRILDCDDFFFCSSIQCVALLMVYSYFECSFRAGIYSRRVYRIHNFIQAFELPPTSVAVIVVVVADTRKTTRTHRPNHNT